MNLVHGKEFYKPLCPEFQNLFAVSEKHLPCASWHRDRDLATTLGSGLARTATTNHPTCVIKGLGLTQSTQFS